MIQTGLKISADIRCERIYNFVGWVKQRKTQPLLCQHLLALLGFAKLNPTYEDGYCLSLLLG
jgi:hypothetical protein